MLSAAAATSAFPPAVYSSPVKRTRRLSWSCRARRISSGYFQLEVRRVSYRPPGTEQNLLNQISHSLQEKSQKYDDNGNPVGLSELLASQRVGIVFQFPDRYILADTVVEEVTFGWPRQKADFLLREQHALKLQNAINTVGMNTISLDEDPQSLNGGFKRRLALAIQLVQTPDLLLLDVPLAGRVDVLAKFVPSLPEWKARVDVVNLKELKKDRTILVVSHDLRELYLLVDRSWRMKMGAILKEEALPV